MTVDTARLSVGTLYRLKPVLTGILVRGKGVARCSLDSRTCSGPVHLQPVSITQMAAEDHMGVAETMHALRGKGAREGGKTRHDRGRLAEASHSWRRASALRKKLHSIMVAAVVISQALRVWRGDVRQGLGWGMVCRACGQQGLPYVIKQPAVAPHIVGEGRLQVVCTLQVNANAERDASH